MKKLLIIVVVLAIAFGVWYVMPSKSSELPTTQTLVNSKKPDPSNATFMFEDGPVTLKDGSSEDTTLTKYSAYGDVNNDGKNDAVVILVQSGGGSGVFVYLGAYVSGNVAYKGTNTIFLGDRIAPQSVSIDKSGVIKVVYLDRKSDEPMAAEPTISTTETFVYVNGQLESK